LFAKYSGLILAFLKTPTDVFVTVLFFTLTTYYVKQKIKRINLEDMGVEVIERRGLNPK
jgi:uncharacterized membrane protein YobD (UPF0266 family)